MFRTILCPVDFSKHSRHALQYAALLTRRTEGQLIALFVEDPLLAAASAGTGMPEATRHELRRFVERAVAPFGLQGESLKVQTTEGKPYKEIVTSARRNRCDLIVMGAHGITGTAKLMMGSTTDRVLRTAAVPVLAIPPAKVGQAVSRAWPQRPALTPVELGRRLRHDIALASEAATALGTGLTLLHVVPPRNRGRLLKARAQLDRIVQQLEFETVVSGHVLAGKPGEQIAAMAEETNVDLVILTRRRGKGLFGPALGSISYQLLCNARTPVLALPSSSRWRSQARHVSADGRRSG
jgi:nucleotide-binding universal stress UspA family protein